MLVAFRATSTGPGPALLKAERREQASQHCRFCSFEHIGVQGFSEHKV
jgi:hypothetical protein